MVPCRSVVEVGVAWQRDRSSTRRLSQLSPAPMPLRDCKPNGGCRDVRYALLLGISGSEQIRRDRPWARDQQAVLPMMGGDITAESEPGRGSTFTIRLPRIVEAPKELVVASSAHKATAALKHH
jgi:hypothetical protein